MSIYMKETDKIYDLGGNNDLTVSKFLIFTPVSGFSGLTEACGSEETLIHVLLLQIKIEIEL